jgi:hypothetical protein
LNPRKRLRIPQFEILPDLKPETSSLNIEVVRSGIKAIVKETQVVQDARSNIEIIHEMFQKDVASQPGSDAENCRAE